MAKQIDRTSYAYEALQKLPEGTTLYTILRHRSKSGMFRIIDLVAVINGEPRPLIVPGWRTYDYERNGYRVTGTGMDMGFDLVYAIGREIHGNGYHFNHRWL